MSKAEPLPPRIRFSFSRAHSSITWKKLQCFSITRPRVLRPNKPRRTLKETQDEIIADFIYCQLPIADCRFEEEATRKSKLAIGNRQSAMFLCRSLRSS